MTKTVRFKINGDDYQFKVSPEELLVDVLRDKAFLTGTKKGCGTGECGACTVLINGEPVNSCLYFAIRADGKEITTIEGLGKNGELHPLQQAFINNAAVQCGFCAPGMLLSASALLNENPDPSETDIRKGIAGNICRCTGYVRIVKAIQEASMILREKGGGAHEL